MEADILKAFDSLVPKDQLLIVAMIIALVEKDKKITEMVKCLQESLSSKKNEKD